VHRFAARLREILIDQAAVRPWPVRVAWNPERCNRGALDTIRKREYGRLQGKPRINKIRVLQRRAYGLRDQEYLRLKVLTCMPPKL
jgi:hypothetical protein